MCVRTSPATLVRSRRPGAAVACVISLLIASPANAQSPSTSKLARFQAGADFVQAFAVGDFAQRVNVAAGGLFQLDVGLGDSIFSIGGEIGGLGYGHASRKVDVSGLIPDIPRATLTVNTDNTMFVVHARLRAQRKGGRWRPYADAILGGNLIATHTSIGCDAGSSGGSAGCGDVPSATNARDLVPSAGAGGGVMISVTPRPRAPRVDLAFRYLRGGEGTYLTKGAIRREGSTAILDLSRSRTDMVGLYVGVVVGR
jgi:hypothetical protein